MSGYTVMLERRARKDYEELRRQGYGPKADGILIQLQTNPFEPPYEKLSGEYKGYYSKRVNRIDRVVYDIREREGPDGTDGRRSPYEDLLPRHVFTADAVSSGHRYLSNPTDMTSTSPFSVASDLRYADIKFQDVGRIDDLWEFERKHSEHRDKARRDFEQLIEGSLQNRLMFSAMIPFIIAPTKDANYVLPQQLPLMCYRGQNNAEWGLQPSICRAKVEGETGIFRDLVNEMRIQEFGMMMSKTVRYQRWTSIELHSPGPGVTMAKGLFFDCRSLAQHFFIPTERLDLTNDVEVALFFACTKHMGGGRYEPLSTDDIRECGQGSIFISLLLNSSMQDDFKGVSLIPIQPYVRPAMQSGFSFISGNLDTDLGISRFVFDHDPDFSEYICEKFENGDRLFKEEGIEWIPEQVKSILESHTFSKVAYTRACRHLGINHKDAKRLLKELESHGNYEIGRKAYSVSDDYIHGLEPDWDLFGYMSKIGMDTRLPTLMTAYGDKSGRFIQIIDRPLAGVLGLIRFRYSEMFKTL